MRTWTHCCNKKPGNIGVYGIWVVFNGLLTKSLGNKHQKVAVTCHTARIWCKCGISPGMQSCSFSTVVAMFLCWIRQRMTSSVWAVTLHKRRSKSVKPSQLTRQSSLRYCSLIDILLFCPSNGRHTNKARLCHTSRPASWSLRLVSLTWPLKHNITFVRQISPRFLVVTAHPCNQIILHEESRTTACKF